MTEKELYRALGDLTKSKEEWRESIHYVASLLENPSSKIMATDEQPQVRLAFIWASENIATETPDAYAQNLSLFAELLHDSDDKVRMEAPEMFRVMGKRRPQLVVPYLPVLQELSENDPNPVVRIHSAGAIRVMNSQLK